MPETPDKPASASSRRSARSGEFPVVTSRSSKQEILSAFEELAARYQERREGGLPQRLEEEHRRHQESLLESAARLTPEVVLRHVAELKFQVASSLDTLGEGLLEARGRLRQVEQAIEVQTERLAHLHDIQLVTDTLDLLLEEHARRSARLEAELEQRQREIRAENERLNAELAAERQRLEEGMRRQQAEHDARQQERLATLERQRQVEEEEYQRQLVRRRETQEADWLAREQELAEREARFSASEGELKRLLDEESAFPQRLEAAAQRAANEAAARVREEMQNQARLLTKDMETQASLSQLRIQALENAVRERDERLAVQQSQLDAANAQVREIALRALESRHESESARKGSRS